MPRLALLSRLLPLMVAGLLALGLGGCGDSDRITYASELDEPNYREGLSLMKAGRRQEALTAFLKVVDKRRDDAPESHLEVGLLYAQHINDPLSAIYHFRKYLALRPNSPQAPLVRQRIDAAIREFARTIPAQSLESQVQRVDLIATLDKLKQENDALKQQLVEARTGRVVALGEGNTPSVSTTVTPSAPAAAPAEDFKFSLENLTTVRTRPPAPAPQRLAPSPQPVAPTRQAVAPVAPPASGARRHVIRPGDTLFKLAQQYYNDRGRWREIYAANRNVMKSETDLRVGVELRVP